MRCLHGALYQIMAGRAMNRHAISILFAALLLGSTTACSRPQPAAAPLAGATIGGPFALIDQDGKPRSDQDFAGRYRIVYFGYTSCPDVCPTEMQTLSAGFARWAARHRQLQAKVVPIFITVDPARDTPAVLKSFVSSFPPLIGLTGSADRIARVAKEYRVFFEAQPAASDGSYVVQHSDKAILFGPDGKPIVIVPVDQGPAAVADTLAAWVV